MFCPVLHIARMRMLMRMLVLNVLTHATLAGYPYWSFFDGKDERIDNVRATP